MFIQNIFIEDERSTDFIIIFSFYESIIIYRVIRRAMALNKS